MNIASAVLVLIAIGLYGRYRLTEARPDEDKGTLRAALIQGSLDTVLDTSFAEQQARVQRTFEQYGDVTRTALERHQDLQLVLWPESMFAIPEILGIDLAEPPAGSGDTTNRYREALTAAQQEFLRNAGDAAAMLNQSARSNGAEPVYFLCGSTTLDYSALPPKVYNSALLIDDEGRIADRYYKTHPVMFGEYIPFGEWFPWIYSYTPMPGGLTRGEGPRVFKIGGLSLCPNICFENTVPHLIRGQVAQLNAQDKSPDLLVNDSNDGWFRGSSVLDLHLRCAIFRCIENRKPMLIAANTGFSAWIDGNGTVQAIGPRRQPKALVVAARPDGRRSLYTYWGDVFAGGCLVACGALAVLGWRRSDATSRSP